MCRNEQDAMNSLEFVLREANEVANGEAVEAYVGLSAAVEVYVNGGTGQEVEKAWESR